MRISDWSSDVCASDLVDVFAFFLYGCDVAQVADISRIHRDESELKGFQRKEIREHVRAIVEFLDSGPTLFPNAIILDLSPDVAFDGSRGPKPKGLIEVGKIGRAHVGTPGTNAHLVCSH